MLHVSSGIQFKPNEKTTVTQNNFADSWMLSIVSWAPYRIWGGHIGLLMTYKSAGERSYCRCIIYISDLYPKAKVAQVDLNNFELYFSHWMKKIKCVAYGQFGLDLQCEHSLWFIEFDIFEFEFNIYSKTKVPEENPPIGLSTISLIGVVVHLPNFCAGHVMLWMWVSVAVCLYVMFY